MRTALLDPTKTGVIPLRDADFVGRVQHKVIPLRFAAVAPAHRIVALGMGHVIGAEVPAAVLAHLNGCAGTP
jgi:hypothetical protein